MTEPPEGERLRRAWAAFDQRDWTRAAVEFGSIASAGATSALVNAEAAFGLAHASAQQRRYDAAKAALDTALTAASADTAVRGVLIRSWARRSGFGCGIDFSKLGLENIGPTARPGLIERLYTLVFIYESAGDIGGTLLVCYGLISIGVRDAAVFVKMGRLWMAGRNNAKAGTFFQKALTRDPQYLPALDGLADIAWIEGDVEDVRGTLKRRAAASIDPAERAASLFKAATVQPVIAFSDTEIDQARKQFAGVLAAGATASFADPWRLGLGPNFYLNYQGRDDRALQEAAALYFLAATPSLGETASHIGRRAGGKIRLGMVSNYFNSHTIGYLNRGLILGLERKRFDLVLFRTPRAQFDALTRELSATVQIVDLPADLAAARRTIADAQLDVLHYPEIGMDYFSYFLAFARLATVQSVGWGHPVTTGIANIDLFLSVDDMEPGDGKSHYRERLIRLKEHSLNVARPMLEDAAASRADLGLDPDRPAYICAQSLYKVHHAFDETIGLILKQDPDGRMYFISHGGHADQLFLTRLRHRLGTHIERVHVLPRVTPQRFLHLLKAADVLLDVPQWSGGKTSLEGFALGTPIVHQPGPHMRGRHTLAFYRRMGVMEPVVDGSKSYADMAVRLVHDRGFRADVQGRIAARSDRLFGDQESVREIETVWIDALNGTK